MRMHRGLLLAICAALTSSISCATTSTSTTTLQRSTIRVGAPSGSSSQAGQNAASQPGPSSSPTSGTEAIQPSAAQSSSLPSQPDNAASSVTNPSNTTDDVLSQPSSVAPLSQISGVQDFVSNTLANQTNITDYQNQLKARLKGYFSDYVASHGYGQPPNRTQSTTEIQGAGNRSCDRLTQTHKRTVTDIYIMQVLLSQTSKHVHRVREVMVSSSC